MVIELTLGNVITLVALLMAAGWALIKVITKQQETHLAQQFEGLGKALTEMRQAQDGNAQALRELERQMLQHEVVMAKDLGSKFTQRKNFVSELVSGASDFHANVGANLTNWQAKPPKISDGKAEPHSVSADALREQVEQEALERTN